MRETKEKLKIIEEFSNHQMEFTELYSIIEKQEDVLFKQKDALNITEKQLKRERKRRTKREEILNKNMETNDYVYKESLNNINFEQVMIHFISLIVHALSIFIISLLLLIYIDESDSLTIPVLFLILCSTFLFLNYTSKFKVTSSNKRSFGIALLITFMLLLIMSFGTNNNSLMLMVIKSAICMCAGLIAYLSLRGFYVNNILVERLSNETMVKQQITDKLKYAEEELELNKALLNVEKSVSYNLKDIPVLRREDRDSVEVFVDQLDTERKENIELNRKLQVVKCNFRKSLKLINRMSEKVKLQIKYFDLLTKDNADLRKSLLDEHLKSMSYCNKLRNYSVTLWNVLYMGTEISTDEENQGVYLTETEESNNELSGSVNKTHNIVTTPFEDVNKCNNIPILPLENLNKQYTTNNRLKPVNVVSYGTTDYDSDDESETSNTRKRIDSFNIHRKRIKKRAETRKQQHGLLQGNTNNFIIETEEIDELTTFDSKRLSTTKDVLQHNQPDISLNTQNAMISIDPLLIPSYDSLPNQSCIMLTVTHHETDVLMDKQDVNPDSILDISDDLLQSYGNLTSMMQIPNQITLSEDEFESTIEDDDAFRSSRSNKNHVQLLEDELDNILSRVTILHHSFLAEVNLLQKNCEKDTRENIVIQKQVQRLNEKLLQVAAVKERRASNKETNKNIHVLDKNSVECADDDSNIVVNSVEYADDKNNIEFNSVECSIGNSNMMVNSVECADGNSNIEVNSVESADGSSNIVVNSVECADGSSNILVNSVECANDNSKIVVNSVESADDDSNMVVNSVECADGNSNIVVNSVECADGNSNIVVNSVECGGGNSNTVVNSVESADDNSKIVVNSDECADVNSKTVVNSVECADGNSNIVVKSCSGSCQKYASALKDNIDELEGRLGNEKRLRKRIIDGYEKELVTVESILVDKYSQVNTSFETIENFFEEKHFEGFDKVKCTAKDEDYKEEDLFKENLQLKYLVSDLQDKISLMSFGRIVSDQEKKTSNTT